MKNINVRVSDELHARIKAAAGLDNRSWNGEAVTLWAEALDARANGRVISNVEPRSYGPDPTGLGEILRVKGES